MNHLLFSNITNGSVFVRRAIAFVIDIVISCVITYVLMLMGYILEADSFSLIAMIIGIALVIGRDAFGRSPGKTMMRLIVINIHTQKKASLFHRIARNITTPFWMIEVIVCRICNGLRITDFWFGTKVISDTEALF